MNDEATIRENRRKAVEALRTTEEPQGRFCLYDYVTGCYCALGVMAVAVGLTVTAATFGLPAEICAAFGIDQHGWDMIADMNDTSRMTFAEIGSDLAHSWGIE